MRPLLMFRSLHAGLYKPAERATGQVHCACHQRRAAILPGAFVGAEDVVSQSCGVEQERAVKLVLVALRHNNLHTDVASGLRVCKSEAAALVMLRT